MLDFDKTGGPGMTLEREVATLTEQVKHIKEILESALKEIREEVDRIRAANENFKQIHDMQERQRTEEIFNRINANERHTAEVDARVKVLEEIPKVVKDNPWNKFKSKLQENLVNAVSLLVVGALGFFAWQYLSSLK